MRGVAVLGLSAFIAGACGSGATAPGDGGAERSSPGDAPMDVGGDVPMDIGSDAPMDLGGDAADAPRVPDATDGPSNDARVCNAGKITNLSMALNLLAPIVVDINARHVMLIDHDRLSGFPGVWRYALDLSGYLSGNPSGAGFLPRPSEGLIHVYPMNARSSFLSILSIGAKPESSATEPGTAPA